ncbi:MAG: type I 3-dehydroquinate dehydratase [Eubacteriaceae bacterium]
MNENKKIEKNMFYTCVPMTSKNRDALFADIKGVCDYSCDYIEWRRDYFLQENDLTWEDEKSLLQEIKSVIGSKGIIYTYRNFSEGGAQKVADTQRLMGIQGALASGVVDYIDIELRNDDVFLSSVKESLNQQNFTEIIYSYHDFKKTPETKTIENIFREMFRGGASVAKVALMPNNSEDVKRLIATTLEISKEFNDPIIAISMSELGNITRVAPEYFGGSLTYLAGKDKTAPGQYGLNELFELREKIGLKQN